jgi:uncharacterized cupin superfamily protein
MNPAHILRFDPNTPISEWSRVAPERLLAGDPLQGVFNLFSDPGQQFHVGLWESEPGTWKVSYSEHEFCTVLEGRIRIGDDAGNESVVGPGDSFVISAGFSGTWQVLEKVRKIYVIFEPGIATQPTS